jgi:tetratricopeptide (TPR) repeat protein
MFKKLSTLLLLFTLWQCNPPVDEDGQNSSGKEPKKESNANQNATQSESSLDSLSFGNQKNQGTVEDYVTQARALLKNKQGQKAFLTLLKAKKIDSIYPPFLQVLGEYQLDLNKSRQAKEAWLKCLKYDAKNIPCRINLGKLFFAVSDYKTSINYFNEVIKLDAYNAEAVFYKGLILRDFYKDTAKAKQFVQQAIELKQDYVEALDVMGVLMSLTQDTLAPFYYKRAIVYSPNNADLYYKLGVYYMNADETNRAIEAYTKATQINPRHADSYYNLGFMFIGLKDYPTAKGYFSKAIAAQERNYKALYGRGYAFEMLGDVINAKKDYRNALEALPMYKPAADAIARINKREQGS